MNLAEIKVELRRKDAEEITNQLYEFLGALRRHGNILRSEMPFRSSRNLLIHTVVPEDAALAESNLGNSSKKALRKLSALGRYSWRVLGDFAEAEETCLCPRRSGFVLFTTFLTFAPPLRCADCFGYVPLYRIKPETSGDFSDVRTWEANYRACDTLQMNCGPGERFGTREMSDLRSGLSKEGLAVCADIEKRTGKPTYYYLYKSSGKSLTSERARKCPKCAGRWILPEPLFGKFDFRCDRCHLLSNVAFGL